MVLRRVTMRALRSHRDGDEEVAVVQGGDHGVGGESPCIRREDHRIAGHQVAGLVHHAGLTLVGLGVRSDAGLGDVAAVMAGLPAAGVAGEPGAVRGACDAAPVPPLAQGRT
jgi:hypothetical protein